MTVWRRYRVPFKDAFVVQCGIEGFCGTDSAEKYFEEIVEKEVAPESEAAQS